MQGKVDAQGRIVDDTILGFVEELLESLGELITQTRETAASDMA